MNRETPRKKDDKAQEHDQGIRESSGWCSARRVLVQLTESAEWWMGDDHSHGFEIAIPGGVWKMVREEYSSWPNSEASFFFFSFFFFFFISSALFYSSSRYKDRMKR